MSRYAVTSDPPSPASGDDPSKPAVGVEGEVGERPVVYLAVAPDAGGQTGARVRSRVNHDDFDYDTDD